MNEPDIAADYDDQGARATHAELVEVGQVQEDAFRQVRALLQRLGLV